ncbi:MAG: SsrA-binding protein [Candidatus Nephrothrix sp. EaCA]|nr:MAG: SsrA-binding protein [Candidatus Nephrothrix sp. EaCA]
MSRFSKQIEIRNKKASFEYEWLDRYTAGLALRGTEIKSIREGKANIAQCYCYFLRGEAFVKGMNINPYEQGTHYNHEPLRERKLLLKKSELRKLEARVEEKGLSLIATRLYVNEKGFAKLDIALAKGKKLHDKRASVKERDAKRELERIRRN